MLEFVCQVEIYQRSEQVFSAELIYSIIFLLTGRARLWYQSVYISFRSWDEVVAAMKKEFLPPNHEFSLFTEINNRAQRSNESYAEFITHIQVLFNCLSVPISEQHKLFIVQRNLFPRYAVAPLEIRSLQELSDACRRIDNAPSNSNRQALNLPFQRPDQRSDRQFSSHRAHIIHVEKSRFFMKTLKYLGYVVNANGISPDPEKISAILDYSTPTCVKDVRRLLGMTGWYRRFIANFATITASVSDLLKKKPKAEKIKWSLKHEESFSKLKQCLVTAAILANPNYSEQFIIQTDASAVGIAGKLVQGEGEEERIICCFSQKLTQAEQNYPTTKRECLAVLITVEKFRPYVYRRCQVYRRDGSCRVKIDSKFQRPHGTCKSMGP